MQMYDKSSKIKDSRNKEYVREYMIKIYEKNICGKLKKYLTSYPPPYIIKDRLKKKRLSH